MNVLEEKRKLHPVEKVLRKYNISTIIYYVDFEHKITIETDEPISDKIKEEIEEAAAFHGGPTGIQYAVLNEKKKVKLSKFSRFMLWITKKKWFWFFAKKFEGSKLKGYTHESFYEALKKDLEEMEAVK